MLLIFILVRPIVVATFPCMARESKDLFRRDRREKRLVGESRTRLGGIVGKMEEKKERSDFRWCWLQLSPTRRCRRYRGISLLPGKEKVGEASDSP